MSAHLLRGGHQERGFSGLVNRAFDRLKARYSRDLEASFAARGAIYAAWAVIGVLAVVVLIQATKKLAPPPARGPLSGAGGVGGAGGGLIFTGATKDPPPAGDKGVFFWGPCINISTA